MNRLNMITLGVDNLKASRSFYEDLFGWSSKDEDCESIAFYNMGGFYLALFPKEELAKDANASQISNEFSGITLAHNVRSKEEVAPFLMKAVSLGGILVKEAQDVFWGGHSGYFKDPNSHYWEVAFNPYTKTLENGFLDFPKD